ncbi:ThiF family adenylyltransferase [Pseudomonas sp. MOB-449]|nr:ThiF family adenylyltransferase [Pseudomonas sp. MOB-449]
MHDLKFRALPTKGGCRRFVGELSCKPGGVPIELSISDWDFIEYPKISILGQPEFLPKGMAHHVTDGSFCYLAKGEVVLDRYDPAGSVLFCLNHAAGLLNNLIANPARNLSDIQSEFQAYWTTPNKGTVLHVGVGNIVDSAQSALIFSFAPGERLKRVISTDTDSTSKMAEVWGEQANEETKNHCWVFRSSVQPPVTNALPWTIKQTLQWLKEWDPSLYKRCQAALEADSKFLDIGYAYFLIDCPAGWVGFGFAISSTIRKKLALSRGGKYRGRALFQVLHTYGGGEKISRLQVQDLSHSFIGSRNLTSSLGTALSGRKVALIGCGAIGGYLAQALARLGAGHGGGRLELFDPQILMPENLGRHALGFKYLFKSKAEALKDEANLQLPGINVEAHALEMRSPNTLEDFDLIVNATGEDAVAEMLNEAQINAGTCFPPLLHVWIKGNGETVQALWTDSREFGCFRCLRFNAEENRMQERFPVLKGDVEKSYRACQHYTPYAVSAPISAVALATDLIVDWLRTDDPSPRFRTRSVETADVYKVKNQNIRPLDCCPACAKT